MMGRVKKELWIGAAVFLVFAVLGALLSEVGITFLSRIVIMALYALSFNLMFGYAGMSSVGHALYFGFGGYALMVYLTKLQVPLLPACILSVLTVIPVAWFLGTACLKNNMLTFSFLTMGLCTTVQLVLYKTAQLGNCGIYLLFSSVLDVRLPAAVLFYPDLRRVLRGAHLSPGAVALCADVEGNSGK